MHSGESLVCAEGSVGGRKAVYGEKLLEGRLGFIPNQIAKADAVPGFDEVGLEGFDGKADRERMWAIVEGESLKASGEGVEE